ncbi:MAG TPA: Gfo/Idh/MocA family oxidoreductase [Clostridiales bacterium]|nr:Gfo/Idh/MocA family oxidoreductase [Clostridiales bacterium]
MSKTKVGIIGCGNIYDVHAQSLQHIEQVEIAAFCDIDYARAERASQKYGGRAYSDYKEMIKREALSAVHICLPHYLHYPVAVYALENYVDVLCEKPISISFEDACKMRQAAERCGRKLGVIFQNRYNPGSVFVKEHIQSGKLGSFLGAKCSLAWCRNADYYLSADWRGKLATEGGGVLINQAIHTLDLIRWLIPHEVSTVEASTAKRTGADIEVEDTAEGCIGFDNGSKALFYFTNNFVLDTPVRIEMYFENAFARIEGEKGTIKFKDGSVLTSHDIDDIKFNKCKPVWGCSHYLQIKEFYEDQIGETVRQGLDEAIKTQKLLCLIYRSAAEKRRIII